MQTCWKANANERPQFADICLIFAAILESNAGNYGYLKLVAGNDEQN